MCVGALLESDVEALVFALPNTRDGAAGTVIQLAQHASLPRRIKVVSGIRRDEAEALYAAALDRLTPFPASRQVPGRPDVVWYPLGGEVSEWLMVPLSKSGVRKHRGFESRPLRQHSSRGPVGAIRPVSDVSGRGRLVDYGAALEMRFGATRRGFESRPLRHPSTIGGYPVRSRSRWVRGRRARSSSAGSLLRLPLTGPASS